MVCEDTKDMDDQICWILDACCRSVVHRFSWTAWSCSCLWRKIRDYEGLRARINNLAWSLIAFINRNRGYFFSLKTWSQKFGKKPSKIILLLFSSCMAMYQESEAGWVHSVGCFKPLCSPHLESRQGWSALGVSSDSCEVALTSLLLPTVSGRLRLVWLSGQDFPVTNRQELAAAGIVELFGLKKTSKIIGSNHWSWDTAGVGGGGTGERGGDTSGIRGSRDLRQPEVSCSWGVLGVTGGKRG